MIYELDFNCTESCIYDVMQYLVDAYETRVAFKEKKKLLAPLPISDDLKVTITSSKRDGAQAGGSNIPSSFVEGSRKDGMII